MQHLRTKGIICDVDGYLVTTWTTQPLPGVVIALKQLREMQLPIAIATNQAGPLWRAITGRHQYPTVRQVAHSLLQIAQTLGLEQSDWYVALWDEDVKHEVIPPLAYKSTMPIGPDDAQIASKAPQKVEALASQLSAEMQEALVGLQAKASADPTWRKPAPGMLLAACARWGIAPQEAIYGGDLESDKEAAHAAGMNFASTLAEVVASLAGG
jgi:histidinol phosphatase-like enzyme